MQPEKFEYDKGYSDAFISQTMDVNFDGWTRLFAHRISWQGSVLVRKSKGSIGALEEAYDTRCGRE
jgi:hypothetical protein